MPAKMNLSALAAALCRSAIAGVILALIATGGELEMFVAQHSRNL
jgi:hypothetical protein